MNEFLSKLIQSENNEPTIIECGAVIKIELPADIADRLLFFCRYNPVEIPQ